MPLLTPPRLFSERLKAFDPMLRVRWSDGQNRWRLERKVTRGIMWPPSAVGGPGQQEDRQSAAEGYTLVATVKQGELTDRVFVALAKADLWRMGGAEKVCEALDRGDQELEMVNRARRGEYIEAAARERFRYMNSIRTVPEKFAATAPKGGMSVMGGA